MITVLACVSATMNYVRGGFVFTVSSEHTPSWIHYFFFYMPSWYVWGALIPAILLVSRWQPARLTLRLWIGIQLVLSIAVAVLISGLLLLSRAVLWSAFFGQSLRTYLPNWPADVIDSLLFRGLIDALLYWGLLAWFLWARQSRTRLDEQLTKERLESALSVARFDTLRSQLRPHFLFNTLNSISMLARAGEFAGCIRMLDLLSTMLRHSLEESRHLIPFADELDNVDLYLSIEKLRMGGALQVAFDIDDDTLSVEVPSFILQPLVENSVHHGGSCSGSPIDIHVQASFSGEEHLVIEIENSCSGEGRVPGGFGIGLANVQDRLALLYGTAATLTFDRVDQNCAVARLVLPIRPDSLAIASPEDGEH